MQLIIAVASRSKRTFGFTGGEARTLPLPRMMVRVRGGERKQELRLIFSISMGRKSRDR